MYCLGNGKDRICFVGIGHDFPLDLFSALPASSHFSFQPFSLIFFILSSSPFPLCPISLRPVKERRVVCTYFCFLRAPPPPLPQGNHSSDVILFPATPISICDPNILCMSPLRNPAPRLLSVLVAFLVPHCESDIRQSSKVSGPSVHQARPFRLEVKDARSIVAGMCRMSIYVARRCQPYLVSMWRANV